MSDFSSLQLRKLKAKLDRRNVQSREVEGRSVDYIEGWFAIAQANAIFGFGGWDREMTHFERIYERTRGDSTSCAYSARVRIRVRAGRTTVVREGSGCGSATATTSGEAHDLALKAAETDATKRALATFGNSFGLGLYDKAQNGVTARNPDKKFVLYDSIGAPFSSNLSAEAFCSGLRQLIQAATDAAELTALEDRNKEEIARLRTHAPALRTSKKIHYAEILEKLIKDRFAPPLAPSSNVLLANSAAPILQPPAVAAPPAMLPMRPSRIGGGPRIDKSRLKLATERRLRDKSHLKYVALQPCLICGREPSQSHHLTFCQRRGVSLKVSDEFTVPLCGLHHDELHRSGSERDWWEKHHINPEPIASELWVRTRMPSAIGMESAEAVALAAKSMTNKPGAMPRSPDC
jgi:DNA recombination protein Rad52